MLDIQPNIGFRWYLNLEMFKRYSYMYNLMIALLP